MSEPSYTTPSDGITLGTCGYCATGFAVPFGLVLRVEHTADFPPHARVAVWAVIPDRPAPDFDKDRLVHECRFGRVLERTEP